MKVSEENRKEFGSVLSDCINQSGTNVKQLCDKIGVSNVAVYSWLSGKSMPNAKSVYKLIDALGVDTIIEREYCKANIYKSGMSTIKPFIFCFSFFNNMSITELSHVVGHDLTRLNSSSNNCFYDVLASLGFVAGLKYLDFSVMMMFTCFDLNTVDNIINKAKQASEYFKSYYREGMIVRNLEWVEET